ncbi:MAG: MarR family winged helix-turn-helix transcriptional regulator [bacterium]
MKNKSVFGFERAADSPGFLLWQTTMMWQRLIKKELEPFEISHAQFVVMAVICWFEEHEQMATQAALISWTKLDKMTVSQALKKLAYVGLVQRADHEIDTRAKTVALTAAGTELIVKLVPLVEQIDANFFGKISISEQADLIHMLSAVTGGKDE